MSIGKVRAQRVRRLLLLASVLSLLLWGTTVVPPPGGWSASGARSAAGGWSAAGVAVPVVRAEEAPVIVPLAYVPNLSNWGPTTATGTAWVWRIAAEVRLTVQGLPKLTGQVYGLWLVNPAAGVFLSVGRFNVGSDGTAQIDISMPGSVPTGISLVLITVQPDPLATNTQPSKVYSIAGSFQGNSAVLQQVNHLPDTGAHAVHPPFETVPSAQLPPPNASDNRFVPTMTFLLLLVVLSLGYLGWRRQRVRPQQPAQHRSRS